MYFAQIQVLKKNLLQVNYFVDYRYFIYIKAHHLCNYILLDIDLNATIYISNFKVLIRKILCVKICTILMWQKTTSWKTIMDNFNTITKKYGT